MLTVAADVEVTRPANVDEENEEWVALALVPSADQVTLELDRAVAHAVADRVMTVTRTRFPVPAGV